MQLNLDIRWWQIAILSFLNLVLLWNQKHSLALIEIITVLSCAAIVEYALQKAILKKMDLKSALISSLSLCLLVRTNHLSFYFLLILIALGSKYLIRVNNKHIFNPTNLAVVTVLFFPSLGWVSPGQFQNEWIVFFFIFFIGLYIVKKCISLDMALYFFGTYLMVQVLWFFYTGDPFTILWHRFTQVSLLIFGFLMITDPRTIPNAKMGRLIFAITTVIMAFVLTHGFYIKNGLFYALFISCLATPIIDLIFKAERFQWKKDFTVYG